MLFDHRETIFAGSLFLGYAFLWLVKRRAMKKNYGLDPHVMGVSLSNLQIYFNGLTKILTAYLLVLIPIHALGIQWHGLFSRFAPLDRGGVDLFGFSLGIAGLGLCGYAQVKMGRSWRVGIDPGRQENLVTTGLYRFVRNPTYTGLMLVCAGLWMIWPTVSVAAFVGVFVLFMEVQTRCEEDFLITQHGDLYRNYKEKTKRYIPYIY